MSEKTFSIELRWSKLSPYRISGKPDIKVHGPFVFRGITKKDDRYLQEVIVEKISHLFPDNRHVSVNRIKHHISFEIFYMCDDFNLDLYRDEISAIEGLEFLDIDPLYPLLSEIQEIIYFTNDTNQDSTSSLDYFDFIQSEGLDDVDTVAYYKGGEDGAGHWHDGLFLILSTISLNIISTVIFEKFKQYKKKGSNRIKSIQKIVVSESLHRLLVKEYGVNPDRAIVTKLTTDSSVFDFHFVIEYENTIFDIKVDNQNKIKELNVTKLPIKEK